MRTGGVPALIELTEGRMGRVGDKIAVRVARAFQSDIESVFVQDEQLIGYRYAGGRLHELHEVAAAFTRVPQGFTAPPKVMKLLEQRAATVAPASSSVLAISDSGGPNSRRSLASKRDTAIINTAAITRLNRCRYRKPSGLPP